MPMVPGFLPSTSGLHFSNSFPEVPDLLINVGVATIPIGNAANGLCGGMTYTVRDMFEAGMTPPPDSTPPSSGPLFDFIVSRLFASFELPGGPLFYLHLMNPDLPDHETWASSVGFAPHGRAWVMIREQWPVIRAELDSGHLSPMALVQVKTHDPSMMGHNHQVLAYGYDLAGTDLTIHLYDPNFPDDDSVSISLSLADPSHTTAVSRTKGGEPIFCFFHTGYAFAAPPPVGQFERGDLLHLAGVTNNGRLWHTIRYTNGAWQDLRDVEGAAGERGFIMDTDLQSVGNEVHLCAVTTAGGLWHTIRFPDRTWQAFGDVEGQTGDRGSIARVSTGEVGGELHVCATNSAGQLWHAIRHASSWTPFGDIESQTGDRGWIQDVDCVGIAGELHVCAVSSDGHLWHAIRHANGSWTALGDVEGQTGDRGTIREVACGEVAGELHVCAASSDGHLWHAIRHANGSWTPFGDVEGQTGDRGLITRVSAGGSGGELHVSAVSSDGHLWHAIRHANSWTPFGDVEGAAGERGSFTTVTVDGLHL